MKKYINESRIQLHIYNSWFLISLNRFSSNERNLSNDNLWGAWYSGLQTVTLVPPQVTTIEFAEKPSFNPQLPNQYTKLAEKTQNVCEHKILKDSSQIDSEGYFSPTIHTQPSSLPVVVNSRNSQMSGARPKSYHYKQANQFFHLSDSSSSTPLRSFIPGNEEDSSLPAQKRGKSCDPIDNDRIRPTGVQTQFARQQMSLDSTCTDETTSSLSGLDNQNYVNSAYRVNGANFPNQHKQFHEKKQQPHDISIVQEEWINNSISHDGPFRNFVTGENISSTKLAEASTIMQVDEKMVVFDSNDGRKSSRRGKLERSKRVEEEYTPTKENKGTSYNDDGFAFDLNGGELPTNDSGFKDTRAVFSTNSDLPIISPLRPGLNPISTGSFDTLDNDDDDVTFIDADEEERDLHEGLLNWLTLSDAPKQSQAEIDL